MATCAVATSVSEDIMMSRKDYQKFADLFAGEFALARHRNDATAVLQIRHIVASSGDIFAQDNPRFQRERFYTAAGFHDPTE